MRNILEITDLSVAEIHALMQLAADMEAHPADYADALCHKTLATLFFEPSTRTRLSFESAMYALGGHVLGFSDAGTSSSVKGETLADTITVVSGYADLIAMRHPFEGAALCAAAHSRVPVINAGDGGHHHPTQTLADLFTIQKEKGELTGLTVGLCGDLRYGRTVHSLIEAMSRYEGTRFVLISPPELALPDFVVEKTLRPLGIPYRVSTSLESEIGSLDLLYMTRVQGERFADRAEYERLRGAFVLTPEKLAMAKKDTVVLHPLPRVGEISPEGDSDPRACYFKQTRCGRLMRMALIYTLLTGQEQSEKDRTAGSTLSPAAVCGNVHCLTRHERDLPHRIYTDAAGITRCFYCDLPVQKS